MPLLRYRAGSIALRLLRDHDLTPERVGAVVGPASGPKWLLLAGIDMALLRGGYLSPSTATSSGRRLLLAGSSAGAWRMATLASGDPEGAHRRLLDGYIGQVFTLRDTPSTVGDADDRMLGEVFPEAEIEHILGRGDLDVGIHVTRLPRWATSRAAQLTLLGAAAARHLVWRRSAGSIFGRVFFHSRPDAFLARREHPFDGSLVPLDAANFRAAALACGTVPYYMAPVPGIPGAAPGAYVDGGLVDYHLREPYPLEGERVVLFPHFRETIARTWLDDTFGRRAAGNGELERVVQIHPTEEAIRRLPGGRLPDQDDFKTFVDDPSERFRRWREAVRLGEELGEILLEDLASGRFARRLEPLAD